MEESRIFYTTIILIFTNKCFVLGEKLLQMYQNPPLKPNLSDYSQRTSQRPLGIWPPSFVKALCARCGCPIHLVHLTNLEDLRNF